MREEFMGANAGGDGGTSSHAQEPDFAQIANRFRPGSMKLCEVPRKWRAAPGVAAWRGARATGPACVRQLRRRAHGASPMGLLRRTQQPD